MRTIKKAYVHRLFPKRDPWSHKGESGKLLIMGGSLRYSGSPALAALAAIRAGTDLTLVAAPHRAADIVASFQPDLITEPLPCDYLCPSDVKHLIELAEWADAVVIGGGLDRKAETYMAIRMFLKKTEKTKPLVLDAEAIRAVSKHPELLGRYSILTPHENEFLALGGRKPNHVIKERALQVKELSEKLNATILLKGHVDVASDGRRVALNRTGNPYLTKGGTGDTLAGICGALLARGIEPFDAACAAAWINGAAGDMALKETGPGFFVSEMLDFIPKVIWK